MDPIDLNDLMYERGRGPELKSCRITVYNLIPYLLSPTYRDELPLEAWQIVTREELAALKQYVADHRDEVMAKHWQIEARIQAGIKAQNTPEFLARMAETHRRVTAFRAWIEERKRDGTLPPPGERRAAFAVWYEADQTAVAGATP